MPSPTPTSSSATTNGESCRDNNRLTTYYNAHNSNNRAADSLVHAASLSMGLQLLDHQFASASASVPHPLASMFRLPGGAGGFFTDADSHMSTVDIIDEALRIMDGIDLDTLRAMEQVSSRRR
jgi:hypothetical protein